MGWKNYLEDIRGCIQKSFRTRSLERELQMIQLSATRRSCIAILWVSLVSFSTITLCVASQRCLLLLLLLLFISLSVQFGNFWIHPHTFEFNLQQVQSWKLRINGKYFEAQKYPLFQTSENSSLNAKNLERTFPRTSYTQLRDLYVVNKEFDKKRSWGLGGGRLTTLQHKKLACQRMYTGSRIWVIDDQINENYTGR